jgi:hypothetical protein
MFQLYICSLFNDVVSNLDYIHWNDWTISNNDVRTEVFTKETVKILWPPELYHREVL